MVGVEFGYGMSQTMLDGYDEYVARLVSYPQDIAGISPV